MRRRILLPYAVEGWIRVSPWWRNVAWLMLASILLVALSIVVGHMLGPEVP